MGGHGIVNRQNSNNMGRAIVNQQAQINITESDRQIDSSFSEQVTAERIGPAQVQSQQSQGDAVASTPPAPAQVNTWVAMSVGDDGLKQAIYNWINTTKDGIRVSPDVVNGRQKKLTFDFYGNVGKSIAPGEIGEFNLIFNYPPQAGSTSGGLTPISQDPLPVNNNNSQ